MTSGNTLYYGDNLDILKRYIKDKMVDLVYLDPPFHSNATYNMLFDEQNGSRAAVQIKAFEDTWRRGQKSARACGMRGKLPPSYLGAIVTVRAGI